MKAQVRTFRTPRPWKAIKSLAAYRLGMRVREMMHLAGGGYYLCPRCRVTLDRDFQSYCDRCGQHLDWTDYRKAKTVFENIKN